MRRRTPPPHPMWKVTIKKHVVAARWLIGDQQMTLMAVDEADARRFGVQLAHSHVGVPPWRPCRRESLAYTTATRSGNPKPTPIYPRSHGQLSLDRFAA